jgi:very-short-patch-repair endonuclease
LTRESTVGIVSSLAAETRGVFRGRDAVARGVVRSQLTRLIASGVIARELPDTYRTRELSLQAALVWAGPAAAACSSAGWVYGLEGVAPPDPPEIVAQRGQRSHSKRVVVHRPESEPSMMIRTHRGFRVTGVEATLVALADVLDEEAFEIACEDARRRRLTSVPALDAYLQRFGERGRRGTGALRRCLRELDPVHPSRSTLEVKARRLLVAHGLTDFVREFELEGHRFDFAFTGPKVILETNGRRWHDDPTDYEDDHEKWSVPARHGYRLVFATWTKVVKRPAALVDELVAALALTLASPAGHELALR